MANDSHLPTRRTVVRGAAWSVPVVSVAAAAPAFAASPCSDTYSYRLDWGTTPYTPPASLTANPNVGTATVPALAGGGPGASPVTVTLTSTLQGTATRFDANLTVLATTGIGGLAAGERGVAVRTTNVGSTIANSQTITVGFSRPVRSVSFTVVDLDRTTTFWDRVSLNPLPTSFVRAVTVVGVGSTSATETGAELGAFRYTGTANIVDTSGEGNVTVNYAGGAAFTSFQIVHWSTVSPGPQGILLSDFTFNALGC